MVEYKTIDGIKYQIYFSNGKYKQRKYYDTKIHGMSNTPIWNVWHRMRKRCHTKNAPYSKYYYKKGIKVCEEWDKPIEGFYNFYKWALENGYEEGLSIDRIDSNKGYSPDNCRFITTWENRILGVCQKHKPKWKYYAYNKTENKVVIFYRADDFQDEFGIDARRVSDGCKNPNYIYKGWRFYREPYNEDKIEGQETILVGSTTEDGLLSEVQVIYLLDKDIVHSA